ncbi:hypothetical protein GCM10010236_78320 [Streptomyces eurythermus]|nr:hypothetical protein GCM10010236_78320 [Streptomyces eurythermus]
MRERFGGGLTRPECVAKHAKEQARAVSPDADSPDSARESFTEPNGRLSGSFILTAGGTQSVHTATRGPLLRRQPHRVAEECHGGGAPYHATGRRPAEVLG